MIRFEAAQLMRLQQGERCLHSGKQRGAKKQNGDGTKYNGESKATHLCDTKSRALSLAFPTGTIGKDGQGPSGELVVGGLLIL